MILCIKVQDNMNRSNQLLRRPAQTRKSAGFTLIEMLAVMAIIATMTALGASYLKRPQVGQNLSLSLTTASSLFQSARSLALTMNTPTKILIHDDPSDPVRYGREIIVIYKDLDPAGVPAWHVQGKPVFLPQGIYFDKVRSTTTGNASDPTDVTSAPIAMNLNYPGDLSSSGPTWLAYEFAPNGTCVQSGEPFYLTSARRDSTGLIASDKNFSGFVLRRMGNATFLPQAQTLTN